MTADRPIALPLPLMYLGSVNVWLLPGSPLTLVDTGPATEPARAELERLLAVQGLRVEDIELVLLTHHHLDHTALSDWIRERSGAIVAAHKSTATWGDHWQRNVAAEHRFARALLPRHGVPPSAMPEVDAFCDRITRDGRPYQVDRVLVDGEPILAGDREWRTVHRPGHSMTDTLYVDDGGGEMFVGDHLLAEITTGAELVPTDVAGDERRRALQEYLGNLSKTEQMRVTRSYPGHGPIIDDHRTLVASRREFHAGRMERIQQILLDGEETAFGIARRLWSPEVAEREPVLVVWEVVGHLDLLMNSGLVRQHKDSHGNYRFRPSDHLSTVRD